MRSMTGFGSAEKYSEELQYGFKVELASINKKQFDLKISMGRELARYETDLRAFIAGRVTRGSLSPFPKRRSFKPPIFPVRSV